MHSMTAAAAANPQAPPDPTADPIASAFSALWDLTASIVPGGNTTLVAALLLLAAYAKNHKGRGMTKADGQKADKAVWGAIKGLFNTLVGVFKVLWSVLRFYGGYEMRGEPKSTATFLKAGTPLGGPAKTAPTVSMASIALAPPKVSLLKTGRPRPWARTTAAWIATYKGKGARALDRALRAVLWLVRAARKVHRAYKAVARVVRTVYGAVAPVVITLARAFASWHCWPYAARGLARLALTAALVGLVVPAWRTTTVVLLVLALGAVVAVACKFKPKPLGDDVVYGPKIWAILREDLKMPADEPREEWLRLPASLAAPDARIVIRLPWTFRGSQIEKDNVTALINSRIPGEWVGRFTFTGEHATAVYTHKPPPKPPAPEPECPERVSFFDADIQEAIANCKRGEVVVGRDVLGRIIIKEMGTSETPHWALSVGTGGGKSSFCQMVIAQLIGQGYYIVAADVKRVSVTNFIGVVGCYIYNDPMNPQDMRTAIDWFKEEISARSAVVEADPTAEFPGILCLVEEANEFADISKEWWDDNRKATSDKHGPADPAADPVWGDVASGARLGRHVYGNILAVFQDLRDQALGGKGLRNLFRLKLMGNYSVQSWKNVIGTTPVPESVDKPGRMMIVEGNSQYWVQTLFAEPDELRAWAIAQRERTGFAEGAGLFGAPPKPSPKRLPRLLAALSRDELPEALKGASVGGPDGETAGGLSHEGADVTLLDGSVTASRDRLRLIPGQAGQEATQDLTAPPELLTLAEVARRLEGEAGIPKADTMRAHKVRRDDFPQGTGEPGKERYMLSQIRAYYQTQQKNA